MTENGGYNNNNNNNDDNDDEGKKMSVYLQTLHSGDRSDWRWHGAHPLVESVFCLISADDCPGGPIIYNLLVGFFGAWRSLGRKQ